MAIHRYLRKLMNGAADGGDVKLRVMHEGGGAEGRELYTPEEVRRAAAEYGEGQLGGAGRAYVDTVREAMQWADGGEEYVGKYHGEGLVQAVDRYVTWEAFEAAVKSVEARKAVGEDGFSVYALSKAPWEVRRACWDALRGVVLSKDVPGDWRKWVAMLAMKPGEAPEDLSRRRDLWVVAGMQKVLMRCLKREYDRAGDERVPGSAAGFTAGRNAPEQTVVARLAREHAMQTGGAVCTAWVDYQGFFMSVVKSCQKETERYCGVHPGVTEIVEMLHEEVTGRYETAHGLSPGFGVRKKNKSPRCKVTDYQP